MKSSASFREMDSEFLEQRARLWIEGLLDERLPEGDKLGNVLADGEILLRVAKTLEAGGPQANGSAAMKTPLTSRMGSRKGYMSYSNADTFIKLCREYGVLDIDLFTPPDLVEGKDFRRVCLTLRSLAKKARSQNIAIPDFDDATKRPAKLAQGEAGGAGKVGDILDQLEGRGATKDDEKEDGVAQETAHSDSAAPGEPSPAAGDVPPVTPPAQPNGTPQDDLHGTVMDKYGLRISPRGREGTTRLGANGTQERSSRGANAGMRVTENVAAKQQQLLGSVSQQYPSSAVPQLATSPKPVKDIQAQLLPPPKPVKEEPQPQMAPPAKPAKEELRPQVAAPAKPQPQVAAVPPKPVKEEPRPQVVPPTKPQPQVAAVPPKPVKEEPRPQVAPPAKPAKEEPRQQVAPPPKPVKEEPQTAMEPPTRDIPMVAELPAKVSASNVKLKAEPTRSATVEEDEIPDLEKKPKKTTKKGGLRWMVAGGAAALLAAVAVIVIPKRKKAVEEGEEEIGPIYSIKKGDTLIAISKRAGKKNWAEIVQLNPSIKNPDLIYPAERIKLLP